MTKSLTRLAALALLALMPGPACAQQPATAPVAGTLLVGNKGENTLSFIDLATGRELGRAATGRMPHEIAVSPDGRLAAVVAYGGRSIDIFDVRTRARLRTVDLSPNEGPHGIVWLADGRILATTERSQSLTLVDPGRDWAVSAIPTGQQGTHLVAVSPGPAARLHRQHRLGLGDHRRPGGGAQPAQLPPWRRAGGDRAQPGRPDLVDRRQ